MSVKRPAFQFYPGDWLRSTDLRSCSVGARGLWIDMICLMHEGNPYGYLKVGDKVILPARLARMVGASLRDVETWLDELEEAQVFSRDEQRCIYSRRMVKDEQTRIKRASGGILGGNPALKKVTAKVENKVNLNANLPPTPATASASATALLDISDPNNPSDELNNSDTHSLSSCAKKFNQNFPVSVTQASEDNFAKFRAAYPVPGNWEDAQTAWIQKKCDAVAQQIFDDIPRRRAECARWEEMRYIPNPEKYLKSEVWKNAIVPKSSETNVSTVAYAGPRDIAKIRAEHEARQAAKQSVG